MKVELESTSKIVEIVIKGRAVPARIWEGWTASNIPVHAYITRIAVSLESDQSEFERELTECRPPSDTIAALPTRIIL
jgi:hypothetical protein